MANSPSSSDYSDTEDYVSDSTSNLSLSVGYFPQENTFSYEDLTRCKDLTCTGSPAHSLPPPVQGAQQMRGIRRLLRRQDQSQDDLGQFRQLSIPLAWDMEADFDHTDPVTNRDLQRCHWWADKWPEENTKLTLGKLNGLVYKLETFLENHKAGKEEEESMFLESTQEEDFLPASSTPPQTAQVSHIVEACPRGFYQTMCIGLDSVSFSKQVMSQETENHSMSTPETSNSSRQLEEEEATSDADMPTPSCLNFVWAFRWLWQQVLASLRRREQSDKARTRWHQNTVRRHTARSNTIEPRGCCKSQHHTSPDI
ncbi:uncharacterized protein C12orf71 homolog [Perognathus longimembris pacificus]|uniref:uncharacterized protein C12orf71 homolog n=1 Tax=Perognathus longimembris pacificus TaxID=214514 RepID=UPI002018672F|nr:uncharacterized protein C12orf71 homolog [Perognathus longimembris pacificus]